MSLRQFPVPSAVVVGTIVLLLAGCAADRASDSVTGSVTGTDAAGVEVVDSATFVAQPPTGERPLLGGALTPGGPFVPVTTFSNEQPDHIETSDYMWLLAAHVAQANAVAFDAPATSGLVPTLPEGFAVDGWGPIQEVYSETSSPSLAQVDATFQSMLDTNAQSTVAEQARILSDTHTAMLGKPVPIEVNSIAVWIDGIDASVEAAPWDMTVDVAVHVERTIDDGADTVWVESTHYVAIIDGTSKLITSLVVKDDQWQLAHDEE